MIIDALNVHCHEEMNEHMSGTTFVTLLRNLNLGAKAETASGKRVTHLEEKTKVDLVKLLQGNVSTVYVHHFLIALF